MSWDTEARTRLQLVTTSLRDEGVVDMLQQVVQRVWAYNVDRHSPADIGDTNRSLGVAAFENIRSLVLREVNATPRRKGLAESVRVSTADNSLFIQAAGVRLRVVKAPAAVLLVEPRWDGDFDWATESEVRSMAAWDKPRAVRPGWSGRSFRGVSAAVRSRGAAAKRIPGVGRWVRQPVDRRMAGVPDGGGSAVARR